MCLMPLLKLLRAGCAQHWNPLERKGWKVQHPPRHSSSRHSGATNAPGSQHTPTGLLRNSFLLGLISCTSLLTPASHHKLKSYPFNHILIQSSSYLLIFNTCFPSKHLSRNLVNPIVAQVLCPCRDTTFLCFPVKHHHPLPFNPCVPVRWALAAGALLLWHSWSAPLILGCHYSQLNSSVISTFSNRYLVLREDLRSAI